MRDRLAELHRPFDGDESRLKREELLFALGRRIGHEWARENDMRKISTEDIRRWYRELEKGGDIAATLARIEAEADRLLAGR